MQCIFWKQTCAIFRWLLYWLSGFLGLYIYIYKCTFRGVFMRTLVYLWEHCNFLWPFETPPLEVSFIYKSVQAEFKVSDLRQDSRTTVGFSVKQDGLTRWQNTQCTTSMLKGEERSCDWCLQPLEWISKTTGCKERNGLNWNLVSSFGQFTVNRAKAK